MAPINTNSMRSSAHRKSASPAWPRGCLTTLHRKRYGPILPENKLSLSSLSADEMFEMRWSRCLPLATAGAAFPPWEQHSRPITSYLHTGVSILPEFAQEKICAARFLGSIALGSTLCFQKEGEHIAHSKARHMSWRCVWGLCVRGSADPTMLTAAPRT